MRKLLAILLLLCVGAAATAQGLEGSEITVPEIDAHRFDVPDNDAMALMRHMGVGWNLGNTFDAIRDGAAGQDDMTIEAYWCGVYTSEEMIEAIHAAGFNTLRLPVSWHNHVDAEDNIRPEWLERVREVADWALSRGMYVILNTHHDVYPEYYYPTEENYERSERYITRVWTQLAERFGDCDDHLIFESMNEPRLKDTGWEWNLDARNEQCRQAADCINRLNQAFVDTVRAAGGNNAARYLMVPAYDASPDNAVSDLFTLPEDDADNRLIVSVHAYTPYAFALQDGGDEVFSLNSSRQTGDINRFMGALYKKYVSKGIPVVIGEYGARAKNGNAQSRVNFAAYYVAQASARNIPCCWWDNNEMNGSGENFGIFRRANCTWPIPEIPQAILRYAGYDKIPE